MLGADVGMVELEGFTQGQLQDLLRPRSEGDVPLRRLLALTDDLDDLLAHRLQRDAELFQGLGGHSLTLVDQAQQQVFGADVVVVQGACFVLGEHDHSSGSIGEALEHRISSICDRPGDRTAVLRPGGRVRQV
ncbi:hypothetical protein SDC9_138235 [bioreactor metagenome]|uniref:Uncharacterized protein n=1 Tax=bioreactor metagenome TaxID=1076179 RepID=A0A645DPG4_9ZZZZ